MASPPRMRHAVAQLVESRRYKPEGCGFDSRCCHWHFSYPFLPWFNWKFSLTQSFRPHYGPGFDSASHRNKYQEYFLGGKGSWSVGLTTLPTSRADCHKIWEPQPPLGLSRTVMGLLYLLYYVITLHSFCFSNPLILWQTVNLRTSLLRKLYNLFHYLYHCFSMQNCKT